MPKELIWSGDALARCMKRKGASETQVGAAVGVSARTVRNWKGGMEPRREHHKVELARYFRVDRKSFFKRETVT